MAVLEMTYVKSVCKIGQGKKCCRYLMIGTKGFECGKLNPELKKHLDDRVSKKDMNARGNNCVGVEAESTGNFTAL